MGIQTVISLFMFLFELVVGKKHRRSKIPFSEKVKKYIILGIIILSFIFNYYLYNRLAALSKQYIKINALRKTLEYTTEKYKRCSINNKVVRELLESCEMEE